MFLNYFNRIFVQKIPFTLTVCCMEFIDFSLADDSQYYLYDKQWNLLPSTVWPSFLKSLHMFLVQMYTLHRNDFVLLAYFWFANAQKVNV